MINRKPVALVYPKLPITGLGNMLFVWANAVLFAHLNEFPVVSPNWNVSILRLGVYLRNEKYKRFYGNLFSNKGYLPRFNYWLTRFSKRHIYYNPDIRIIDKSEFENRNLESYIFIFDTMKHYGGDCFLDLREYQSIVKQKLISAISPIVYKEILSNPSPEIGIHVRLSDFVQLKPNEDFNTTTTHFIRTPISWYATVLSTIREVAGYNVPATIFSDGYDHELNELLSLPNVSRSHFASALSDMLTLSRSKLLIATSGSTFSYWASYLGQCPTIWHPNRFHAPLFTNTVRQSVFEGGFDPKLMTVPNLLVDNIKSLF